MNRRVSKRLAKKIAKRYLEGGDVARYLLGATDYWVDGKTAKGELIFPLRIERAILHEARRCGWNGCHWDSPLMIYFDDGDGPVFGYGARMNTRFNDSALMR